MQIITGRVPTAIKVLIYGPEGIGKTTFASMFPEPLFIDTEGSTVHMDVRRLPRPLSWTELLEEADWVRNNSGSCRTLVVDTADWAEQLCNESVCARDHKTGIEDYGYGKGYTYAAEEFGRLLDKLELLVNAGINVVFTAHAQMRKFEQPDELGAYDRWETKLGKKVGAMIREWVDMVLFANYKTIVVNVDNQGATKGKNKAQGGKRVMYTTHHPCWDAKNRFGLPEEMDFSYEGIRAVIEGNAPQKPQEAPQTAPTAQPANEPPKMEAPAVPTRKWPELPESLEHMMLEAEVDPDEVRYVIAQKGIYPADTPWKVIAGDTNFMNGWLLHPQVWPQVVNAVRANRTDDPF